MTAYGQFYLTLQHFQSLAYSRDSLSHIWEFFSGFITVFNGQ